jgi:hypothetical protein
VLSSSGSSKILTFRRIMLFQGQSIDVSTSFCAFVFGDAQNLDVSEDRGAFILRVKQRLEVSEDRDFFRVKVLAFPRPVWPLSSASCKALTLRRIVVHSSSGSSKITVNFSFLLLLLVNTRLMSHLRNFSSVINHLSYYFISMALWPHAGHDLLIREVSRLHTTTHHSR